MTPVLDKGWIRILATGLPGSELDAFLVRVNRNQATAKLLDIPSLALEIRCPLFVQLFIAEQGIQLTSIKTETTIEAYVPTVADIGAPDLQSNESIQANIERTTEALLLNTQMYQMDHCDKFIAQVNSPVSTYNTIVAWASLRKWLDLISQLSLPKPVEAYRKSISDVLHAEWPNLSHYMKQMKR